MGINEITLPEIDISSLPSDQVIDSLATSLCQFRKEANTDDDMDDLIEDYPIDDLDLDEEEPREELEPDYDEDDGDYEHDLDED